MTTHTVGQQRANVGQQSSSAETKPVVRRIENSDLTCEKGMMREKIVEFERFTSTLETMMTTMSQRWKIAR